MNNQCPYCLSDEVILFEPRLNNRKYLCLVCNELSKLEEDDCLVRIPERWVIPHYELSNNSTVFDHAWQYANRDSYNLLIEMLEWGLPFKEKKIIRKMLEYMDERTVNYRVGYMSVSIRVMYNSLAYSALEIRLDEDGIFLTRGYYEKDDDGIFYEKAMNITYPPADEQAAGNMQKSLKEFREAVYETKDKTFLIQCEEHVFEEI